jgi:streptogramin lyase
MLTALLVGAAFTTLMPACATGAGSLWVSHYVAEAWRIDPDTTRVTARIHLNTGTTRSIAFGGGRVWVSTESGS